MVALVLRRKGDLDFNANTRHFPIDIMCGFVEQRLCSLLWIMASTITPKLFSL
jgi:hypothetical protein